MKIIYMFYGFISTYYFLKICIPILSNKLLDIPNERSSHIIPTPTGGGIIFPIQSILIAILSKDFFTLIALPLAFIGFIDDKFHLSSSIRFLSQIFSAVLIINIYPNLINNISNAGYNKLFCSLLLIFIITAFINFINFMDGIDGLVGSCMFCGFIFISFQASPTIFIIIGSLLGFLKWNWNPAKIFMGDVGSTFLAIYFLIYIMQTKMIYDSLGLFLILSPLLIDALFCVLKRLLDGQNIFRPHKLHLYQRLCQSGISQKKVVILYSSASVLIGLVYYYLNLNYLIILILLITILGFWLDKKIAIDF